MFAVASGGFVVASRVVETASGGSAVACAAYAPSSSLRAKGFGRRHRLGRVALADLLAV